MLHVTHQPAQTLHFAANQLRRLVSCLWLRNHIICKRLTKPLYSRQRCHQVMGNVSDQFAPHLVLAAQFIYVSLDLLRHGVKSRCQPPPLIPPFSPPNPPTLLPPFHLFRATPTPPYPPPHPPPHHY